MTQTSSHGPLSDSPLVKTAVYGEDPNWGRIVAAAGRSGAEIDPESSHAGLRTGTSHRYAPGTIAADLSQAKAALSGGEVRIELDLALEKSMRRPGV